MPRRNYIDKKAYKKQKRKLENKTKVFVDYMNMEMGFSKKVKHHQNNNDINEHLGRRSLYAEKKLHWQECIQEAETEDGGADQRFCEETE